MAGFMLGYAFDIFFDTMPIFLFSFGLLGFIGGFKFK